MDPFKINHQAQITSPAVRRIRRGHLWIYAGEWEQEPENEDPAIVQVVDSARNILGYAFYSRRSQILLRLFSRDTQPPTKDLLRALVRNAIARRRAIFGTSAAVPADIREGDLLPGINRRSLRRLPRAADAFQKHGGA